MIMLQGVIGDYLQGMNCAGYIRMAWVQETWIRSLVQRDGGCGQEKKRIRRLRGSSTSTTVKTSGTTVLSRIKVGYLRYVPELVRNEHSNLIKP